MATVTQNRDSAPTQKPSLLPMVIMFVVAVALTIVYTAWGGIPAPEYRVTFIIGVGLVLALIAVLIVSGWHLLVRPITSGKTIQRADSLSATLRTLLAVLISVTALNNVVGIVWDDVWHHTFGIPLGKDFFWAPHILIYTFLGSVSLIALVAFYFLGIRSKGTYQRRFRANPVVGILVLAGIFFVFATPTDPLWHTLYGAEIGAWSFPHILLLWSISSAMMMVPMLLVTTMPKRDWGSVLKIRAKDVIIIATYAFMSSALLILLTTEWDGIENLSAENLSIVMSRPDWLLTTTIVFIIGITGSLALHTTRRTGSAILMGVLALGIRASLLEIVGTDTLTSNAWIIAVVVLLSMEIAYAAWGIVRGTPAPWWAAGIGATLGLIAVLPFFDRLFVYPILSASSIPMVIVTGFIAACATHWAGRHLAERLWGFSDIPADAQPSATENRVIHRIAPAAYLIVIVITVAWAATAPPPPL